MSIPHDADFYTWAMEQAALLRAGKLDAADVSQIAEELESLGRSEAAALRSAYRLILLHLLKWQFQPTHRGQSGRLTILRERLNAADLLDDNPGLKPHRAALLAKAYPAARLEAAAETGLALKTFPDENPFTLDQVSEEFWPE